MRWDTDLADRSGLRSQRLAPLRAEPTDDCSPFTPRHHLGIPDTGCQAALLLPHVIVYVLVALIPSRLLHLRQPPHFVLETIAALCIVAKPVKAGAGRRQENHAVGRRKAGGARHGIAH